MATKFRHIRLARTKLPPNLALEAPGRPARQMNGPDQNSSPAIPSNLRTVTDGDDQPIDVRVGSPFTEGTAVPPPPLIESNEAESIYDVGPLRYTAMGAVIAAAMVLFFAAIAAWWFPPGGTLIAALGCVLAIMGMFSHFRKISAAVLVLQVLLFLTSYSRTLA